MNQEATTETSEAGRGAPAGSKGMPTGYNEATALSDLRGDYLWLGLDDNTLTISRSPHHRESFKVVDSITRDYLVELLKKLEFESAD